MGGTPQSLHLDAYGVLTWADGYEIQIKEEPPMPSNKKLYFVNLRGYDKNQFTEKHKNVFVVAENNQEAKQKALTYISDWESPHRDYQFEVDNLISVNALVAKQKYFIHLIEKPHEIPLEFTCTYLPIGKE